MSEKKQKVLSIGLWHMLSYRINLKILINFGDVKVQKKKKTKKATEQVCSAYVIRTSGAPCLTQLHFKNYKAGIILAINELLS